MKKLICILGLAIFSQMTQARALEGMINWGPFINCEVYNDSHRPVRVSSYEYIITYTNGAIDRKRVPCQFNCQINPYAFQRFSGPQNSPYVMSASCRAFTKNRRHPRPHPRY